MSTFIAELHECVSSKTINEGLVFVHDALKFGCGFPVHWVESESKLSDPLIARSIVLLVDLDARNCSEHSQTEESGNGSN